ncbi:sensor histidine kinase [Sphingomonas sp. C3-2]|uniref:sensor histidine kinase n=1 Tax=Sphingomonas sp. C3-2 TaxID=3062169 RepID=UPI00294AF5D6|nr:histidine kinase [Sphingomonas sp. C3-2]WOK35324.1 histidine kinase [Sphingomonas sp. C3-2]
MEFAQHDIETPRTVRPLVAFYSIIGFWLFYGLVVTLRAAVMDFPEQGEMTQRRIVVTAIGIVLTWGLYLLVRAFDRQPLWVRVATAFIGAIPCAIAVAAANYYMFNVFDPHSLLSEADIEMKRSEWPMWKEIAELAINRFFFFCAWAALYIAISYAGEVRVAERRAAQYARAAQQAELRSLRYQVNPHFLFNTLNSLSSLILKNRPEEAEAMIMNLSTFYRTSLSGDPLEDVTLEEEVRLQKLYLDIEAVRFPERLRTRFDIPEDLLSACVPGLLLQPLVENAIKYGVSRASRPVTIAISARSENGWLVITIADNGKVVSQDNSVNKIQGAGIGLANVRDRLAARFGDEARIEWMSPEEGGFIVRLTMPETRRGCR